MRTAPYLLIGLLLLSACHSKPKQPVPQADDLGTAQVTSIDDLNLPVDKSDQITSIDAATGDASGMPAEGGGVIEQPKPEANKIETPADSETLPLVTPPPPTVPAPPVMENPLPDAQ